MKRLLLLFIPLVFFFGCDNEDDAEDIIPISEYPEYILGHWKVEEFITRTEIFYVDPIYGTEVFVENEEMPVDLLEQFGEYYPPNTDYIWCCPVWDALMMEWGDPEQERYEYWTYTYDGVWYPSGWNNGLLTKTNTYIINENEIQHSGHGVYVGGGGNWNIGEMTTTTLHYNRTTTYEEPLFSVESFLPYYRITYSDIYLSKVSELPG